MLQSPQAAARLSMQMSPRVHGQDLLREIDALQVMSASDGGGAAAAAAVSLTKSSPLPEMRQAVAALRNDLLLRSPGHALALPAPPPAIATPPAALAYLDAHEARMLGFPLSVSKPLLSGGDDFATPQGSGGARHRRNVAFGRTTPPVRSTGQRSMDDALRVLERLEHAAAHMAHGSSERPVSPPQPSTPPLAVTPPFATSSPGDDTAALAERLEHMLALTGGFAAPVEMPGGDKRPDSGSDLSEALFQAQLQLVTAAVGASLREKSSLQSSAPAVAPPPKPASMTSPSVTPPTAAAVEPRFQQIVAFVPNDHEDSPPPPPPLSYKRVASLSRARSALPRRRPKPDVAAVRTIKQEPPMRVVADDRGGNWLLLAPAASLPMRSQSARRPRMTALGSPMPAAPQSQARPAWRRGGRPLARLPVDAPSPERRMLVPVAAAALRGGGGGSIASWPPIEDRPALPSPQLQKYPSVLDEPGLVLAPLAPPAHATVFWIQRNTTPPDASTRSSPQPKAAVSPVPAPAIARFPAPAPVSTPLSSREPPSALRPRRTGGGASESSVQAPAPPSPAALAAAAAAAAPRVSTSASVDDAADAGLWVAAQPPALLSLEEYLARTRATVAEAAAAGAMSATATSENAPLPLIEPEVSLSRPLWLEDELRGSPALPSPLARTTPRRKAKSMSQLLWDSCT